MTTKVAVTLGTKHVADTDGDGALCVTGGLLAPPIN